MRLQDLPRLALPYCISLVRFSDSFVFCMVRENIVLIYNVPEFFDYISGFFSFTSRIFIKASASASHRSSRITFYLQKRSQFFFSFFFVVRSNTFV